MSPLLIWAVADVAASDPMAAVKALATSADSMRLDISVPPIAGCCATAGGRRWRAEIGSPDTKFAATSREVTCRGRFRRPLPIPAGGTIVRGQGADSPYNHSPATAPSNPAESARSGRDSRIGSGLMREQESPDVELENG